MIGLEVSSIALGSAVAKAVCGVWLRDPQLVSMAGTSAIDHAAQRFTRALERRKFLRIWEETAELIANRVEPLVEGEFRDLPSNERDAAVMAVHDTFDTASLTEPQLFKHDLDAGYLDRFLRAHDPDRVSRAGLSDGAARLYDLLLRECSAYAVEFVRALPVGSAAAALAELLRRDRQVLDELASVLHRLPARRGVADFERDYCQLVANQLDRVEFFGATLSDLSRRYPLSVSYVELKVASRILSGPNALHSATSRVSDVLARSRRLLVRGSAGAGKTTMLQWIAVQSARASFGHGLSDWNGTVPFFVPIRRYAATNLPSPDEFALGVGRHIADEMPPSWVQEQLRTGRAVVLIDGVDELPEERRADARRWLEELTSIFPAARYVITSQPAAVPSDWLVAERFDVAEIQPMDGTDVSVFVHRWHEAVRSEWGAAQELDALVECEERLLAALDGHRHLYRLARSPLLCALLCALHRDRRGQLPSNRMELYEVALHMLLERRDVERGIESHPALSRTEKTLLLQDLAYWLIRNDWSDAPRDLVISRLRVRLASMAQVTADADAVYRVLLERSGLLREPIGGRVDFIHRTFQEYLAAKQAVDDDDVGILIRNAHLDQWKDVVTLAAGHAASRARTALIEGLLQLSNRRSTSRSDRERLRSVALACIEMSPEVPAELAADVRMAAEDQPSAPYELTEASPDAPSITTQQSADPAGPPTSPDSAFPQREPGIRAVVIYSDRDATLAQELATALESLREEGILADVAMCQLSSHKVESNSTPPAEERAVHLTFLVVTPDLISSGFSEGRELRLLIHQHHEHKAMLLPVVFKTTAWRETRFGHLSALPVQGQAIIDWKNREEAYNSIIESTRLAARRLTGESTSSEDHSPGDAKSYSVELKDVFKLSGAPTATFVEPECFAEFRASLHQPGLGIVIEGPSGIGKTTLLRRAIQLDKGRLGHVELLSGRKPDHIRRIKELAGGNGHQGVVTIDDFHHLPGPLQEAVAGYFNLLADDESHGKLVIVGIPGPSRHLISVRADVATRTSFFKPAPATEEMIIRMIEKGEDSLNITFANKDEIARAAGGSLLTAQALCWHLAVLAGIEQTSGLSATIHSDFARACKRITESLAVKYQETVRRFTALDYATETVCIDLLLRLGQTLSGVLRIDDVLAENSDWQDAIQRVFLHEGSEMPQYLHAHIAANLHFDPQNRRLIAPDPQFLFYIRQFEREQLMEEAGKRAMQPRTRIFICYSHADTAWLQRLQIHLNPLERAGIVDVWSDRRINVGDLWQKEIVDALAVAKIALLLVSADMLASDFVRTQELPALLAAAEEGGCRVIPILVGPSMFTEMPSLSRFQAANLPSVTLSEMSPEGADRALMRLAQSLLKIMDMNLT